MFAGENCSTILQKKLPPKLKDLSSFIIPCTIGNTRFGKAMLDLRASINVMPYSIYASLNLGDLKEIGVVIQLIDRSNAHPKGVLEDVLVQVNELYSRLIFMSWIWKIRSLICQPRYYYGDDS